MRTELVDAFSGDSVSETELNLAVTHWLQNAAALPLSMNDEATQEFCRRRQIDLTDLEQAADAIGLNVAVVDDVIRLDAAAVGD
jgi:hypothetical protein